MPRFKSMMYRTPTLAVCWHSAAAGGRGRAVLGLRGDPLVPRPGAAGGRRRLWAWRRHLGSRCALHRGIPAAIEAAARHQHARDVHCHLSSRRLHAHGQVQGGARRTHARDHPTRAGSGLHLLRWYLCQCARPAAAATKAHVRSAQAADSNVCAPSQAACWWS